MSQFSFDVNLEEFETKVLQPADSPRGGMIWRATDGTTFSTDSLAAHCERLLERWTKGSDVE